MDTTKAFELAQTVIAISREHSLSLSSRPLPPLDLSKEIDRYMAAHRSAAVLHNDALSAFAEARYDCSVTTRRSSIFAHSSVGLPISRTRIH